MGPSFLLRNRPHRSTFALEVDWLAGKWLQMSAEPLSYCLYHSIIWTFLADLLTWWQFDSLFGIPRSTTGQKGAKP